MMSEQVAMSKQAGNVRASGQQVSKWPTSKQTISQAAVEQENKQNRTVIGETHTNSATCAAEKKRVGKSCKSSVSLVENLR